MTRKGCGPWLWSCWVSYSIVKFKWNLIRCRACSFCSGSQIFAKTSLNECIGQRRFNWYFFLQEFSWNRLMSSYRTIWNSSTRIQSICLRQLLKCALTEKEMCVWYWFNSVWNMSTKQASFLKGTKYAWPRVFFPFSCSAQLCMKISLLINMKMPTLVGIFIFISREFFFCSAMFSKK